MGIVPPGTAGWGRIALGDESLYLMGGHGAMTHAQLWTYGAPAGKWEYLGPASNGRDGWPPKRYCPVLAGWNGRLYLWGGRDSQGRAPEFFNDLWEYDPDRGAWTCIQENRADDVARPSPRYGLGYAVIGDCTVSVRRICRRGRGAPPAERSVAVRSSCRPVGLSVSTQRCEGLLCRRRTSRCQANPRYGSGGRFRISLRGAGPGYRAARGRAAGGVQRFLARNTGLTGHFLKEIP